MRERQRVGELGCIDAPGSPEIVGLMTDFRKPLAAPRGERRAGLPWGSFLY